MGNGKIHAFFFFFFFFFFFSVQRDKDLRISPLFMRILVSALRWRPDPRAARQGTPLETKSVFFSQFLLRCEKIKLSYRHTHAFHSFVSVRFNLISRRQ
jgi:hypothetical protein